MYKILLSTAAAVLMTGSLANAQFLLGQDENGHKQVTNVAAGQVADGQRHAARIAIGSFGGSSGAFLLGEDANGNKAVINTYGPRRAAAAIPAAGMTMSTTGRVSPGFLLVPTGGHKKVLNQYAR